MRQSGRVRTAERRALSVLAAISAVLLFASPAFGQVRRRGAGPPRAADEEIAWEKYLVKDAPEPTFRFAVAHLDAATGCYGYLYITRETIRYEVRKPESNRGHAFSYPRSSITEARQWKLMASRMTQAEFKFLGGKIYHFFRVREGLVDEPRPRLRWEDVRTWQPLIEAATRFDDALRSAEQQFGAQVPATPSGPTVRVVEPAVTDPQVPVEVNPPAGAVRGGAPPAATSLPAPKVIPGEPVTVEIFSEPIGADIMLDGDFVGNTPSILKVRPGTHYLNLLLPGFKPWEQPLSLEPGGKLTTIRATLEKTE